MGDLQLLKTDWCYSKIGNISSIGWILSNVGGVLVGFTLIASHS